ncbi:MAG: hypothetical protein LBQ14_08345 [Treponema sp.]|nr:hypothetical protein [Treponema sp.]
MFNPRLYVIAGGAGFILSLLIGFISGAGFLAALLRALAFAVIFALFAGGAYWVIGQFLPELLSSGSEEEIPGSRINISVNGDDAEEQGGVLDPNSDSFGENVLGLDQKGEEGYTSKGEAGEGPLPGASFSIAVPTAADADGAGEVDTLPDLDAMAEVFIPVMDEGQPQEVSRPASGNKPEKLDGDFNAKEMASAIQTILKRDEKG